MDSPLTAALAYTDAISLKYYQSSFVIDFSTFDYPISTNTRFSYKLEGYDDDWSIPSTLNFAAYKTYRQVPTIYMSKPAAYQVYGVITRRHLKSK